MTIGETEFLIIRLLTCGIWIGAGLYKLSHFRDFIVKIEELRLPFPPITAGLVVAIELMGTVFILLNFYVWAVAVGWIVFVIYATYLEHRHIFGPDERLVFPEYIQVSKNISILGGLLALLVIDPSTPEWLVSLIR